ncbi:MAG TPA: aspartate--tRNA(Asn) ligase [Acidimicrobiales bacterium]|nr:aspartate--tRNA(Asn) ligase [Acidimicrobiales bacterium]
MSKLPRTMAGQLAGLVDQDVRLCGWVEAVVEDGDVPVLVLRDPTGFAELRPDPGDEALAAEVCTLRRESAVEAEGRVTPFQPAVHIVAPASLSNAGSGRVVLQRLRVVGPAVKDLPVDESTPVEERLDWRFLDLRRPRNRVIFEVQTTVEHAMREVWRREGFVELHSPKFRPTPNKSGSELFTVDYFGRKAYLAQSPQFYKQMAMASGLDRIFEIGPVFRANPLVTSRHDTEFTSVDVEMSWVESHHDVMAFEERWLRHVLEVVQATHGEDIARWFGAEVTVPDLPFPRVHMADAHKILDAAGHEVKGKKEGDLDAEGERLVARHVLREMGHEFVFVTDYPEWIRPYYHMRAADDPARTRSFDLLWKGLEVTTGAQREHRPDVLAAQARARGVPLAPIDFYLEFFRYGCPPHGGFGLGLTRFLMSLLDVEDVRQVTYLHRGPNRITP